MKLLVAGATGFVATEVIRQALALPNITSIIALARRPVEVPTNLQGRPDIGKLSTIVLKDFGTYTQEVKQQLAGIDACIWTLAITPTKSRSMDFAEVRKVCVDYAVTGLKAIYDARDPSTSSVLRFIYMSGISAERDPTKKPSFMPEYSWMRGDAENQVLAFAAQHPGQVEVCAAKPGLIIADGDYLKIALSYVLKWTGVVPNVSVYEIAAAMLDQIANGFEKEPLFNDDLARIGKKVIQGKRNHDIAT